MLANDRPRREEGAQGELRQWVRARGYWGRAAQSLELALSAADLDVRNRYLAIAQHYRVLAEAEERSADRRGAERRSRAAPAGTDARQ